ncbi:glycosyltransferase family 4 protein [Cellulomonas timonensis]|uniref:glycosyltransferase family 4 protein n=1 Tax=Cellulomonas timonensis TaxID=1689271 RepID=UPI0009EF3675|nr:glycosyltransferase family 4 protein [Cellulomonas timonensis]
MSRPTRVVVLDHTAQLGGAELALVRLCAALDPARVQVIVVLFAQGPLVVRLEKAGVKVRVLPLARALGATDRQTAGSSVWRAGASAARTAPFVLRLAWLLRALRPDVVHATSLKADLLALPAARLARIPLVWHVHDRISDDYLPARLAQVFRWAARHGPEHVVVNSRATASTLLPMPRGWTLAHPGLTSEQLVADPDERLDPSPAVVGLVGRISPTKGQLEFVQACAALAERHPKARFRVVGAALFAERAYEAQVRELVERLALGDRLELTGWAEDPTRELDGLSILVHASPAPEPFGQVIVEAMARGVPVVATRGGGVEEIAYTPDGSSWCELVEPHDVAGLARAVDEVLSDPATARLRARAAWEDVRVRFGIDRTADGITRVWELLASRPRG